MTEALRPSLETANYALSEPDAARWRATPDEKALLLTNRLEGTIRVIRRTGAQVLVVHPIPRLQDWQSGSCAVLVTALRPTACGVSRPLETALGDRRLGFLAEQQAARVAGALTMDPGETICPASTCHAWRDGLWWYRDAGHLSVDGALALAPRFRDSMRDALRLQ